MRDVHWIIEFSLFYHSVIHELNGKKMGGGLQVICGERQQKDQSINALADGLW